jgi:hypothetical protein
MVSIFCGDYFETVIFYLFQRIQESLHHMNIRDSHEQLARKKETEFLSKKIGEYAGHVRHLEVSTFFHYLIAVSHFQCVYNENN